MDKMKELVDDLLAAGLQNATFFVVPRVHEHARIHKTCSYLGMASACQYSEVLLHGHKTLRGMRFVCCPEVRGSGGPYLGGRNVQKVCYDRLGAGSLFVLRRLSASQSVHYQRFHCTTVHVLTYTIPFMSFAESYIETPLINHFCRVTWLLKCMC